MHGTKTKALTYYLEDIMANIVVIGSANMDTVYSVPHIPAPGETISSLSVMSNAGGKGANQAVAAGRAGGDAAFIGAVGMDSAGGALKASLADAGVDTSALAELDMPTGSAFICVSDSGENCIVVHPGANACVSEAMIDSHKALISGASICVMQLEVPHETIWHAARICRDSGVSVLLNPSPVAEIPADVLAATGILVPNEHEAEALLGCVPDERALKEYCARTGVKRIVMTMGSHGVWNVTRDSAEFFPCNKVRAVDTTGAGDCFLGALAACLSRSGDIDKAIRFAMAASAIAVTRPGAQQAMPTEGEICAAMNGQ
jgi:ribokinase